MVFFTSGKLVQMEKALEPKSLTQKVCVWLHSVIVVWDKVWKLRLKLK